MSVDSPLGSAHSMSAAASETWPKASLGYFLTVASTYAVLFLAVSEPPDIQPIAWAIVMVPVYSGVVIVVDGILWFFLASLALGAFASISCSIRIVGNAFFRPAMVFSVVFFVLLLLRLGVSQQRLLPQIARGGGLIVGLWCLVNIVRGAKRPNFFGDAQLVLFVLWFFGILALLQVLRRNLAVAFTLS